MAFGTALDAVNGRDEVIVGVRPEALELAGEGLAAGVEVVEELGPTRTCSARRSCRRAGAARRPHRHAARAGPRRAGALRPSADYEPHLFAADSGERL